MKVPFTWKVTGWLMVGWSPQFPDVEVGPLRYLGEVLVAYRDGPGELHVLEAHCKHLGARIGHRGTIVDDCVKCPFHGWRWGPDGTSRYIPYQPDRPNRRLRLRVFPVLEQYGCVFVWHHPHGNRPHWEMPDIFTSFPQFEIDPAAHYRPYRMALRIHSHVFGRGGAISAFADASNHRLIFACTPVDDRSSNMFYAIWWPRNAGDASDVPPEDVRERVEKQHLVTVWDDLNIWRYQNYVEHPALSKVDAKPCKALRNWATQCYDCSPRDDIIATA